MIAGAGGIHRLTQLLGREMTMDALVNSRRALRARDGTNLHGTLEWLRQEGDFIETQREVNPDLEITGLQKHMDGGPPALFHNMA
jgi:hypothetical protein